MPELMPPQPQQKPTLFEKDTIDRAAAPLEFLEDMQAQVAGLVASISHRISTGGKNTITDAVFQTLPALVGSLTESTLQVVNTRLKLETMTKKRIHNG